MFDVIVLHYLRLGISRFKKAICRPSWAQGQEMYSDNRNSNPRPPMNHSLDAVCSIMLWWCDCLWTSILQFSIGVGKCSSNLRPNIGLSLWTHAVMGACFISAGPRVMQPSQWKRKSFQDPALDKRYSSWIQQGFQAPFSGWFGSGSGGLPGGL